MSEHQTVEYKRVWKAEYLKWICGFANAGGGVLVIGRNDAQCILRHPDGTEESKPLGWEDVRDLPTGYEIIRTVMDDTLPGGPREKQITYAAPFDRCDREADYRQAWTVFEERLGEEKA